jgi:hypothetical protein
MRLFIPKANIPITVFFNLVQDTNNQRENLDPLMKRVFGFLISIESKLNISYQKEKCLTKFLINPVILRFNK